jgi:hypothetical protein
MVMLLLDLSGGFVLRAVVPDRHGQPWAKWLNRNIVLDSAPQAAGGMFLAPRQVLRQGRYKTP